MRLTVIGVVAIASSVISFLYSLTYLNPSLMALSLVIASMVIHDYYYARSANVEGLEVRRSLGSRYVRELEVFNVEVSIVNRSERSFTLVEVEDCIPMGIEVVEGRRKFSIPLPRGFEARVVYKALAKYPGEQVFEYMKLCVYSPMMMFHTCFDVDERSYLIVIPLSLDIEYRARSFSRITGLIRGLSAHGLYDLEGFRDYVYGDDVRKVLWRVLAKEGRLMVRIDRGEAIAKIGVALVLRRYTWIVGKGINTLAHQLLRAFESMIEALSMPGVIVDAFLLSSETPRVILGVSEDLEKLYRGYSWISYLSGFVGDPKELVKVCGIVGIDLSKYDFFIVVTDLYTLTKELSSFVELLSRVKRGLVLALRFAGLGLDDAWLASWCSKHLELVEAELEVPIEGFEVLTS